jgi:hypothetical protein
MPCEFHLCGSLKYKLYNMNPHTEEQKKKKFQKLLIKNLWATTSNCLNNTVYVQTYRILVPIIIYIHVNYFYYLY